MIRKIILICGALGLTLLFFEFLPSKYFFETGIHSLSESQQELSSQIQRVKFNELYPASIRGEENNLCRVINLFHSQHGKKKNKKDSFNPGSSVNVHCSKIYGGKFSVSSMKGDILKITFKRKLNLKGLEFPLSTEYNFFGEYLLYLKLISDVEEGNRKFIGNSNIILYSNGSIRMARVFYGSKKYRFLFDKEGNIDARINEDSNIIDLDKIEDVSTSNIENTDLRFILVADDKSKKIVKLDSLDLIEKLPLKIFEMGDEKTSFYLYDILENCENSVCDYRLVYKSNS